MTSNDQSTTAVFKTMKSFFHFNAVGGVSRRRILGKSRGSFFTFLKSSRRLRNICCMELKCAETTGPLIDLFFSVYNTLGHGFLEHVYSNAMIIAGEKAGLRMRDDVQIKVLFEGCVVGEYEPDLLVNDQVIVELKACKTLMPVHEAQLLNYLRATSYEVGLLLNFGPKPQYKRMVFDNARKGPGGP